MGKPAWVMGARTGPVHHYMDLIVFACEGLIVIVDERIGVNEGQFTVVTPADLDERVKGLNRKYRGKGRMEVPPSQRPDYDRKIRGSQECVEAIKEARAMGDPSDPAVQLFWAKHRRTSTVRVNFSAGADPAGYPDLPIMPLGHYTGRTAKIDGEAVVPPNLNALDFTRLHKTPKRKNRTGIIVID